MRVTPLLVPTLTHWTASRQGDTYSHRDRSGSGQRRSACTVQCPTLAVYAGLLDTFSATFLTMYLQLIQIFLKAHKDFSNLFGLAEIGHRISNGAVILESQ